MARLGYMFKRTFTRHPERSEAKSKDPVALIVRVVMGFLDFARNDQLVQCFFRRSCLRISDTITPWILSSRAGTRSG